MDGGAAPIIIIPTTRAHVKERSSGARGKKGFLPLCMRHYTVHGRNQEPSAPHSDAVRSPVVVALAGLLWMCTRTLFFLFPLWISFAIGGLGLGILMPPKKKGAAKKGAAVKATAVKGKVSCLDVPAAPYLGAL